VRDLEVDSRIDDHVGFRPKRVDYVAREPQMFVGGIDQESPLGITTSTVSDDSGGS
jgi:hypothetical protein